MNYQFDYKHRACIDEGQQISFGESDVTLRETLDPWMNKFGWHYEVSAHGERPKVFKDFEEAHQELREITNQPI